LATKTKTKSKAKAKTKAPQTSAEDQYDANQAEEGLWDDPGVIMDAIKVVQNEFEGLRDRFQEDFEQGYQLQPYEPKSGYESYTSSAPKNFFDKIVDGVNRAALTVHVNTGEDALEEERADANEAELFLEGAFNHIDRLGRKTRQKALRRQLAFFSGIRGWVVMRALVYVPMNETETKFDVKVWDPMHVYWEDGVDGAIWVAHQRKATRSQIYSEYGVKIEGKDGMVTDFWTEDQNMVLVDATWLKEPADHNIGHVPVFVGNVGDMPDIQNKDFSGDNIGVHNTLEYQGESVWTAARGVIEPRNRYISQLMDTAKRSVAGSLVHKSPKGDKKIKGDPYASFQAIPIEEGESIEPLELPTAPPETAAILGLLDHDWQQSTLPYPLAYGGSAAAESGRALAIRIEATRSAYSPRTHLLREAYQWLSEELLSQFANKAIGNKKIELYGDNPMTDTFFRNGYEPNDIKPEWIVDVIVEPRLPRDEQVEIEMALSASTPRGEGRQPLMSTGSARKDIMKLKNPDLEEQKVLAEEGKEIPPIKYRRIANAVAEQGDPEGAKLVMEWVEGEEMKNRQALAGEGGGGGAPQAPAAQPTQTAPPSEDEMVVVEAVMNALIEYGREDLAQELAGALDGTTPPRDGLIEEIMQILGEVSPELAQSFMTSLQGGGQPAGA
jgi:hypothetical protein